MDLANLITILEEFLKTDREYIWIIAPDVFYEGDWDDFKSSFSDCRADFLATELRAYEDDPNWRWWQTIQLPPDCELDIRPIAAFLPVMRFSRSAGETFLVACEKGYSGHLEAIVPTVLANAGLKIEDIGGIGRFTPTDRRGKWYDSKTWQWRGPIQHHPGFLHYPVAIRKGSLPGTRIKKTSTIEPSPRILYASAVGKGAEILTPKMLKTFQAAGADVLLFQYSEMECDLASTSRVTVIRQSGFKWQFALQYMKPEEISQYDYIFLWDDDIDPQDFDPREFVSIMAENDLQMAQPSLMPMHPISHPITKVKPTPLAFASEDDSGKVTLDYRVVGRLTNFVEIMVPVFTRAAWEIYHTYLEPENRSGWGYDFIPLSRKGVIDTRPVIHTRPVQSVIESSQMELRTFLESHGLFAHPAVEQGWLLQKMHQ